MIANINPRGHSFRGVTAYLLHDKGAETSERVLWSETRNLHTNDIEKASRFMAWTDGNRDALRVESGGSTAGRKAERGSVYHYSLSWRAGSRVDVDAMLKAADETLDRLGLAEHQAYLVAHSDTEHAHVHIVANLVHPTTGLIASNYRDQKTLDRWANEYELEHGVDCKRRAAKYEKWEQERPAFNSKQRRAERAQVVTAAFHQADNGQAFVQALEAQGLTLARGTRRGFVVVDQAGDVYALNRLIDFADGTKGRAKSKAISARLGDVDRDSLPEADALAEERTSYDRDAAEVAQQAALSDAAERSAKERAERDRVVALRERQEQEKRDRTAERAALVKEQQMRWRDLQRQVKRKMDASRRKWQIDELQAERQQAARDVEALGGFWARVFKRRQIAEAKDRLQNLGMRLEEREARFLADVEVFEGERPDWLYVPGLDRRLQEVDRKQAAEPVSSFERQGARRREYVERMRHVNGQRREYGRGDGPDLEL